MRKVGYVLLFSPLFAAACSAPSKTASHEPAQPEFETVEPLADEAEVADAEVIKASFRQQGRGDDDLEFVELDEGAANANPNQDQPARARQGGNSLAQDARRLTLAQQKKEFLVETHLQNARELRDQLQLEEAERELGLEHPNGTLNFAPVVSR